MIAMPRHVRGVLAVAFVVVLVAALAAASPEPSAAPVASNAANAEPARLVAIGDVHGDFAQLRAALLLSELIDPATDAWRPAPVTRVNDSDGALPARGVTELVLLGDLVDRGPDDLRVLEFAMQLQKQAAAAGDRVVILLGNHELMNLQGHFHYVHPESYEPFGGKFARRRAFAAGAVIGDFVRSSQATHTAFGSLFVHAGLLPADAARGLNAVNAEVAEALAAGDFGSRILATQGPLWTRKQAYDAAGGACSDVAETLRLLGLQRMVVGHTPQRSGRVEAFCDDSFIAVDVGLSKWMYGNLAALEMTRNAEGEVELREIFGEPLRKPQPPKEGQQGQQGDQPEVEQQHGADKGSESLEGALMEDPVLLHELLDVVREVGGEQPRDEL